MLIDYGELDKIVKPIIGRMDHRYILSSSNILMNDPYRKVAFERGDVFELPTAASTAELLAEFLWNEVFQALRLDYPVYPQNLRIIVKETPKSSAAYQGEVPK
jgi:6-pyruvoyl-tetrahydropterin synthase